MIFKQLNVVRATEKGESYCDRKIMTEKEKFAEKYNNTLSKFSANLLQAIIVNQKFRNLNIITAAIKEQNS